MVGYMDAQWIKTILRTFRPCGSWRLFKYAHMIIQYIMSRIIFSVITWNNFIINYCFTYSSNVIKKHILHINDSALTDETKESVTSHWIPVSFSKCFPFFHFYFSGWNSRTSFTPERVTYFNHFLSRRLLNRKNKQHLI